MQKELKMQLSWIWLELKKHSRKRFLTGKLRSEGFLFPTLFINQWTWAGVPAFHSESTVSRLSVGKPRAVGQNNPPSPSCAWGEQPWSSPTAAATAVPGPETWIGDGAPDWSSDLQVTGAELSNIFSSKELSKSEQQAEQSVGKQLWSGCCRHTPCCRAQHLVYALLSSWCTQYI